MLAGVGDLDEAIQFSLDARESRPISSIRELALLIVSRLSSLTAGQLISLTLHVVESESEEQPTCIKVRGILAN